LQEGHTGSRGRISGKDRISSRGRGKDMSGRGRSRSRRIRGSFAWEFFLAYTPPSSSRFHTLANELQRVILFDIQDSPSPTATLAVVRMKKTVVCKHVFFRVSRLRTWSSLEKTPLIPPEELTIHIGGEPFHKKPQYQNPNNKTDLCCQPKTHLQVGG